MDDQLELLLADGVIDEVLGRLKSGKEANVSLVRRGDIVLAAKVYKDRETRSFKNNADYKEGRKVRNTRTQRAMDNGGKFGRDADMQAWKSTEADAMYKLAGSGVRIPAVVMFYEGVLLMDLVLDADGRPAPRMIDVSVDKSEALGIYADLVAQLISMLCLDVIHGDLSPYNILAAADGPTIIDFPQVISAVHNSRAEYFFLRDFDNVVRFMASFDPALAVHTADGRAIWRAYVSRELTPEFVPPPPPPPRPTRGPDRRGPPPQQRGRNDQWSNGNARAPQRNDSRGPQQPRNGGPPQQQARNGGPPQPRNGGPPPRNGDSRGPQQSYDSRGPQRSGGPPRNGDSRGPQQSYDSRGPQRNGGPPPRNGDSRGPQQSYDSRGPQQPRNGGPPQHNGDSRSPQPSRNGGPQQPRSDSRPRNDSYGAQPRNGAPQSAAPRPSDLRAPRPQRAPQSFSSPAPRTDDAPKRGGRRRPKRRW